MHSIEECEYQHVEHAASQNIADSYIRNAGKGNRADAGNEFRQRCNRGHENDADPRPPETGLFSYDVAILRKTEPA
jgi:hypothetical protein